MPDGHGHKGYTNKKPNETPQDKHHKGKSGQADRAAKKQQTAAQGEWEKRMAEAKQQDPNLPQGRGQ